MQISLFSVAAAVYENPDFHSSPIHLQVTYSQPCDLPDSCNAVFVLQNLVSMDVDSPSPETFTTLCAFDDYSIHSCGCRSGDNVLVHCNGSLGTIVTHCPYLYPVGVCNSVVGTGFRASGCKVISFTATNTTCSCPMSRSMSSNARRSLVDESSSSQQQESSSVDIVSMTKFVGEGMLQTWSSAGSLDAATVKKGWEVILTIGVFAAIVVLCGALAHRADTKAKNVAPKELELDRASWALQKRGSSRNLTNAKLKRKVMESEATAIENSLPSVLRSKTFSERLKDEMKQYHRWMGVIFHYSPVFPRVLRVASLATNIVTMLFVQAITYKLTNPDDGSCELLKSEADCLVPTSPFQTGESKCHWVHGFRRGSCHFSEPSDSFKVVLFVAILAAMFSTPIALIVEWIIMNVLAARTMKYRRAHVSSFDAIGIVHRDAMVGNDLNENIRTVLSTSLDEDCNHLVEELKLYRGALTVHQRKEFDGNFVHYILDF